MTTHNSVRSKSQITRKAPSFRALYAQALPSRRSGSLFGAFPYPTKISPEAIALFIAAHTEPGDTVFDGFAGSGTTGLAALLCERPSPELRRQAKELRLDVKWGARNAILYELSALGALVGNTLTNPPEPLAFSAAAEQLLNDIEKENSWLYEATDPDGNKGTIRYTLWSDLLRCPECSESISLYDGCVSLKPARIHSWFSCPMCKHKCPVDDTERVVTAKRDPLTGITVSQRARVVARLYGKTGKGMWSRPPSPSDKRLLARVSTTPIPDNVPNVRIPWGDLYRRGYHQGMTHLHHFYTRRNLIAFARLWERTCSFDSTMRDALRFWLLSYNASHATIMTRVVAKRNQKDLVVTSAQPGVLYVSGLPVEKNLFLGLRRKLATITRAFSAVHGCTGRVEVRQKSSRNVELPDQSIDYVFTDPPFGGNIPYAELNFLNEAWLGCPTDRSEEIIVSNSQSKTLGAYRHMLTDALGEAKRILCHSGKATLVFHSASAAVWKALHSAYSDAGFFVENAGVLNKTQGSFKQVTTTGAVKGDPLLLLGTQNRRKPENGSCVWSIAEALRKEALTLEPAEQTQQRLYSRLVGHYLIRGEQVPVDANDFYRWHEDQEMHRVENRVAA